MRLGVLVLVAGALALSACAKDEKDAGVENGACTDATLDAYNHIESNRRNISLGLASSDARSSVADSCQKLQGLLNGRSCKATLVRTGEEFHLSYATVQKTCDPLINKSTPSSSSSTPIPATKPYSRYVDKDGRCTEAYKSDVEMIRRYLNKALKNKSKEIADAASYYCSANQRDFNGMSCKTYDSRKGEFVTNSASKGELAQLCVGAQRLSDRFN